MGRLRAAQEKHSVLTLRGEKKAMTFAEHPFGGFLFPAVLLRTKENLYVYVPMVWSVVTMKDFFVALNLFVMVEK